MELPVKQHDSRLVRVWPLHAVASPGCRRAARIQGCWWV